jgi:hypothetical protein
MKLIVILFSTSFLWIIKLTHNHFDLRNVSFVEAFIYQ